MSPTPLNLPTTTRPLDPALVEVLRQLQPGQRIRITHIVRVGHQLWPAVVTGVFRGINALVTGLSTHRVPEDDIIVPAVHFTKDNGELSCVTLDENSKIEILSAAEKPILSAPSDHVRSNQPDRV
jgi:hypothetical protein